MTRMPTAMDLNADAGEGGPDDGALFAAGITSVNAACGAHAGDDATLAATARLAAQHGVAFGAHPGYADREGFGRREIGLLAADIAKLIAAQLVRARAAADAAGVSLTHVKPHGALYHRLRADAEAAAVFIAEVSKEAPGAVVYGPPDGALRAAAQSAGAGYVPEGFLDRGYQADGTLIPRGERGAVLDDADEIAAQVRGLAAEGRVRTLCAHGDGPEAARWITLARATLLAAGLRVEVPVGVAALREPPRR